MLTLKNIYKKHNAKIIFEDADFIVHPKDKIALIGANGVGKTTLLKILMGTETMDQGERILSPDLRIASLSQNFDWDETLSVSELMKSLSKDNEEFEVKSIFQKLGVVESDKLIYKMSGGEQKRVALAQSLLKPCDLLLLDEPTNHLDLDMIEWLESYLKKFSKAVVMVTHDRYFLERVTNQIVEISRHKINVYEGSYEQYLETKQREDEDFKRASKKHVQLMKKELEWVRAGVLARGTKSKDRLDRFEKMKDQELYKEKEKLQLQSLTPRIGKTTIGIHDISYKIGERMLFENLTYECKRFDRIGIIGPNGCGKTTLLNVIAKELEPLTGEIVHGETVKLSYFKQVVQEWDLDMRLMDFMEDKMYEYKVEKGSISLPVLLDQFLFPKEMHYQKLSFLSGGELRRLYLMCILLESPNVILLDEPTNDVDIETIQLLEEFLDDFRGVVICVSHDRSFLDHVCDGVLYFTGTHVQMIPGIYSEYRWKTPSEKQQKKESVARSGNTIQMSSKEKNELRDMDDMIAKLEGKIEDLDKQMQEAGEDYELISKLASERDEVSQELESKMERWIYLSELMESLKESRK